MRNSAAMMVDADTVRFQHSYTLALPNDSALHSLAERDLGYFTAADDPVGSDRTIRSIEVRLDPDATNSIFIGGPQGAAYELLAGESFGSEAAFLGQTFLLNSGAGEQDVMVLFKAMDE